MLSHSRVIGSELAPQVLLLTPRINLPTWTFGRNPVMRMSKTLPSFGAVEEEREGNVVVDAQPRPNAANPELGPYSHVSRCLLEELYPPKSTTRWRAAS